MQKQGPDDLKYQNFSLSRSSLCSDKEQRDRKIWELLVLPCRIVVVLPICRAQWLCWGPQLLFESVTQEVWV